MKILKKLSVYCSILAFYCLFFAGYSYASSPFIADISVTSSSSELLLSAKLKGGFTTEIEEIIHSGAPATFTYYIKLMRYRSGWYDSTECSKTIKRTVKYDVLKKEYKFSEEIEEPASPPDKKNNSASAEIKQEAKQNEKGSEASPVSSNEKVTKDIEELKKWLANLESIKITSTKPPASGSKYYINIKADLKTIKLWFPFNYILFFVSLWDVTTDWEVSSPFTVD